MKKFIVKTILFLVPLILIAVILHPVFDQRLKRSNSSPNNKEWDDIFQSKINADLIIQGNSRAWVHISPKEIDSAFKLNSYNLGLDGYSFHMEYYRFLIYLKHNKKPGYIIQTTDYQTLNKRADLYQYAQFVPYLGDDLVKVAVKKYEGLDDRDFYIPFYKYFHYRELIQNALDPAKKDPSHAYIKYKGFEAQNKSWDTTFLSFKKAHPAGYTCDLDTMTLKLFDLFVKYCHHENIKLIFVNPPVYWEANKLLKNRNAIDSIYRYYSRTYNIPFLDYSNDSICLDTANFYNSQHLNTRGVARFNRKLLSGLKNYIPATNLITR